MEENFKDKLKFDLHELVKQAILSASAARVLAPQDDIFNVVAYLSGSLTNDILKFIDTQRRNRES